ncbi:hypothetical protein V8C26DRAFT_315995 [Trichoderma gracile]
MLISHGFDPSIEFDRLNPDVPILDSFFGSQNSGIMMQIAIGSISPDIQVRSLVPWTNPNPVTTYIPPKLLLDSDALWPLLRALRYERSAAVTGFGSVLKQNEESVDTPSGRMEYMSVRFHWPADNREMLFYSVCYGANGGPEPISW